MRDRLSTVENGVSFLLRMGVILCSAIIATGWIMSLIGNSRGGSSLSSVFSRLSHGEVLKQGFQVPSFHQFISLLAEGNSDAVVLLGLVLLISLPILRVALSAIIFMILRDYLYVFFSCTVLSLLLFSIFWGHVV